MARLRHRRHHKRARYLGRAPDRLRFRLALRHCLPILQHRAHVRRVGSHDGLARGQGGRGQLDEL